MTKSRRVAEGNCEKAFCDGYREGTRCQHVMDFPWAHGEKVDRDEQCEGLSLLDAATGVMAMRLICAKERRNVISLFLELIKKFGLKDADVHELAARYRRLMEATGEVPEDAAVLEMKDD
jgi:hypothetical protein